MSGELIIYCGPMFAAKTTGLIAEIQMQLEACPNEKIRVYKPSLDHRYSPTDIRTHAGHSLKDLTGLDVQPVPTSFDFSDDADFVAIDEAQFFDKEIISAVFRMLKKGTTVVIAGLDLDSDGKPFGPMPELLALANHVEKHLAICSVCDEPASRTFRKVKTGNQIQVGGSDLYEPRCLDHWFEGMNLTTT